MRNSQIIRVGESLAVRKGTGSSRIDRRSLIGELAARKAADRFISSPGLVPNRSINLLVERRTAGGELTKMVVLGAHQRCAVAEGPAQAFRVEHFVRHNPPAKIRLRLYLK